MKRPEEIVNSDYDAPLKPGPGLALEKTIFENKAYRGGCDWSLSIKVVNARWLNFMRVLNMNIPAISVKPPSGAKTCPLR